MKMISILPFRNNNNCISLKSLFMISDKIKVFSFLVLLVLSHCSVAWSQEEQSSDGLFQQARHAAFEKKQYPAAIELCKKALAISPAYTDIEIFLGRLYTWSGQPDSARKVFELILQKKPGNEEASVAYASLEFWNNNSEKALIITEAGLTESADSPSLLLLKAKLLNDLGKFREANQTVNHLLKKDPKNTEARALADRIKESSAKNNFGLNYDYIYFDKQFNDPWHLASVDYGRQTKFGSLAARLNYANRFAGNGAQVELEAYPRISKTFYAYTGAGYSDNVGIFPKYRAGFSLYVNLPASFEAEAGFRYLRFSNNTWVYTLSAGKYYKNYWFNLRTYITPSNQDISHSYSVNIRYYYGGSDDYFSIGAGAGISPDDTGNNILLNNGYKLRSDNISAGYRHAFNNRNIFSLNASWVNQEYKHDTRGNQLNLGVGYQRRF
jgi:YaiO family outer membrane protein